MKPGTKVRVTGGKYKGKMGVIQKPTQCMYEVELEDGNTRRMWKENVIKISAHQESVVQKEEVADQKREILQRMAKLRKEMQELEALLREMHIE
jgi:hypothetical protein